MTMRLKAFSSNQQSASRAQAKHRDISLRRMHRKPAARRSAPAYGPNRGPERSNPGHPAEETALVGKSLPAQPSSKPLDSNKEKMLTVKEAAFRLSKSADAVYLWLRAGRLRGWQPGGRCCAILVDASTVEEALVCPAGTSNRQIIL